MKNILYIILYFLCKFTSQNELCVLEYHSIGSNGSFYTVNVREFQKQVDYLRNNYKIVSLSDITQFVRTDLVLHKKFVSITFDDGYYDNYLNVYPYFKKHGLPASIFISTGYIGKMMTLDNITLRMLDWNEIREMNKNNICIGAHTIRHKNLTMINLEEAKDEILGSKEEIEKRIGEKVNFFAYPFDQYNDKLNKIIQSIGFKNSFNGSGLIRPNDNPYHLNRVSMNKSINFLMFKIRLTKAVELYDKLEQLIKNKLIVFSFYPKINQLYERAKFLD